MHNPAMKLSMAVGIFQIPMAIHATMKEGDAPSSDEAPQSLKSAFGFRQFLYSFAK